MKRNKAFTIAELLVGLGILSLVATGLYAVFSNGILAQKKARIYEDVFRDMYWALKALSDDLEAAVPYHLSGDDGETESLFAGEKQALEFVRATGRGLVLVRYFVEEPEASEVFRVKIGERTVKNVTVTNTVSQEETLLRLIRQEIPLSERDRSGEENAGREILCENIPEGSFSFSYAGPGQQDQQPEGLTWSDEWAEEALPVGVRVDMALAYPGQDQRRFSLRRDILIPLGMI